MFIPTNFDGQKLANLRKKTKRINKLKKISLTARIRPSPSFPFAFISFFFFKWNPHVLLFHFLVRLNFETIYFVPVSISFILIEYSLNIFHFSEFF